MRATLLLTITLAACTLQTSDYTRRGGASTGPPAVPGSGISATQVRSVSGYDRLRTEGFVDVVATVAAGHRAELTCDDNVLPHLDTIVEDRTLVVRVRASAGELRPEARCLLKASAPAWTGIESSGSGNVVASAVESDAVVVAARGSGDVAISGRARSLAAASTGSGSVDAEQLIVSVATARAAGSGMVTLTATETVSARASGSGDIVVHGGAEIDSTASGSGRVVSAAPDPG